MSSNVRPKLVSASLVRVRCFLNRRGMRVKPWLGPKEVLAAFHATLVRVERDDSFWRELKELLAALAKDLRDRAGAQGLVLENELLDARQHEALLREIRNALGEQGQARQGLHRLAEVLSAPAAALLLMVGAAVAVGCGGNTASVEAEGTGGQNATGGNASSSVGGAMATGGRSGGTGGTNGQIIITPTGGSTAAGGSLNLNREDYADCDQELVDALLPCPNVDSSQGSTPTAPHLLDCVCLLDSAWQSGLRELFAGSDCQQIEDYFGCCGIGPVCGASRSDPPPEYDVDLLVDNSCCMVYLGVRA